MLSIDVRPTQSELLSMRLNELSPTHESFMLLERHLNDGSPSGFSSLYTPAPGFRATDNIDHFELPVFDCASFGAVMVGDCPTLRPGELPVHPDMVDDFLGLLGQTPTRLLSATATSSGRTLSVLADGTLFYAKVAYQRLLGRVTRKMTRGHVLSAIEVSAAYENAISAGQLPPTLHIYREHCGLYFSDTDRLKDWGYVERAVAPYPSGHFIQIPAFSLIAAPEQGGPSLLDQLVDRISALKTREGFFSLIVRPLLDLYFSSVSVLGLQPEAHAQNVVFLLDDNLTPVGVALRDMESVDKDVPLLEALSLKDNYSLTGYKFLTNEAYNYQIMHSFMYDFKLGNYLLGPLVDGWKKRRPPKQGVALEGLIRDYARAQLSALPDDFFPVDTWYDYEAVVHEGASRREYRTHPNPRFR